MVRLPVLVATAVVAFAASSRADDSAAKPAAPVKTASVTAEDLVREIDAKDPKAFLTLLLEAENLFRAGGPAANRLAGDLLARAEKLIPGGEVQTYLKEIAKKSPVSAAHLLLRVVQSRRVVAYYKKGSVVVGRLVVADGKTDPELVMAQMPIQPNGYFAGEVGDLKSPVVFLAHGYEKLEAPLDGKSGDVVVLGDVTLKPCAPEHRATLKGRLVLDGAKDASVAKMTVGMGVGKPNTPHGGYSPRSKWPRSQEVKVASNGEFTVSGLSPCNYFFNVTASGHNSYFNTLSFEAGRENDVGEIRLTSTDIGFYIGKAAPKASGDLPWEKDYAAAMKRAKAENKPVMVMMTATWCGPCKMLEKQTLADPWIRHFVSGFIIVKAYEDREVEKKYGVSGYPTLVFTDSNGVAVHKTVGFQEALPFLSQVVAAEGKLKIKPSADVQTLIEKKLLKGK